MRKTIIRAFKKAWIWLALAAYVLLGLPAVSHEISPGHKFGFLILTLVYAGCLVLMGFAFLITFERHPELADHADDLQ